VNADYVAGLFDGEGTVLISAQMQLVCSMTLKEEHVLIEVQTMYGGRVRTYKGATDKHCAYPQWQVGDAAAVAFLTDMAPRTIIKQLRVRLALEFQEYKSSKENPSHANTEERVTRLEQYSTTMRMLNQRGPGAIKIAVA